MPGNGWISLHRKIQRHWLWETEKPFDKRSAWIDILLLVNHEPCKIFFNNEIVNVNIGEHITSEVKLAERWGWSRTKVRTYLDLLEQDKMIKNIKDNGKRTRLRVLNYGDYQDIENRGKTGKEQGRDSKQNKKPYNEKTGLNTGHDSDYRELENSRKAGCKTGGKQGIVSKQNTNNKNNNINNDNKEINNMSPSSQIDKIYNSLNDYWKELFQSYIDIYKSKNKTNKITDNKHYRLLKEINQILQEKKFSFDGKEYQVTEDIFEDGINTIVEKGINNLNYAKKVMVGQIEGGQNDRVSKKTESKKERSRRKSQKEKKLPDYNKAIIWG